LEGRKEGTHMDRRSNNCHLLHVCCAPDLVISYLAGARGDIFFYNPNIHPREEYEKRLNEVLKLANLWDLNVLPTKYEPELFFEEVAGMENDPEGGKRCEACFRLRLEKSAQIAHQYNYASFSTTLTASPKKNVILINSIGISISKSTSDANVTYLPNVYRKSSSYNDAQKLIKQLGIYRQNYCGCVYSMSNSLNLRKSLVL